MGLPGPGDVAFSGVTTPSSGLEVCASFLAITGSIGAVDDLGIDLGTNALSFNN